MKKIILFLALTSLLACKEGENSNFVDAVILSEGENQTELLLYQNGTYEAYSIDESKEEATIIITTGTYNSIDDQSIEMTPTSQRKHHYTFVSEFVSCFPYEYSEKELSTEPITSQCTTVLPSLKKQLLDDMEEWNKNTCF